MKDYSPELDALLKLGKTFILRAGRLLLSALKKSYRWLDKPHIIRIRKKTIIIGLLILALLYQLFVPSPTHIVYAGSDKKPTPVSPLAKSYPKIAELPQTDAQPLQTVDPVEVAPVSTPAPNTQSSTDYLSGVVANCGDNTYANYIYMHESSCSTTSVNSIGCVGIGQACPGSKLYAVCPNLDYACENSFFTAYATAVYGGWAGAYSFWLGHSWW